VRLRDHEVARQALEERVPPDNLNVLHAGLREVARMVGGLQVRLAGPQAAHRLVLEPLDPPQVLVEGEAQELMPAAGSEDGNVRLMHHVIEPQGGLQVKLLPAVPEAANEDGLHSVAGDEVRVDHAVVDDQARMTGNLLEAELELDAAAGACVVLRLCHADEENHGEAS